MEFLNSLLMRLAVERKESGSWLMELLISLSLMGEIERNASLMFQTLSFNVLVDKKNCINIPTYV